MDHTAAVEAYLERCATLRRLSPKTIEAYRTDLKQFVEWFDVHGRLRPGTSQNDLADKYVAYLNSQYKPRSAKRKITVVRAFVSSLGEEAGDLALFADLKNEARVPRDLPRTIRPEDLRCMLELAENECRATRECGVYNRYLYARTSASLELLTATGMRIGELCSLKDDDIDLGGRVLRILGKGSKERVVQLECDITIESVERYLDVRNERFPAHATKIGSRRLFLSNVGGPYTDHAARKNIEDLAERAGAHTHVTPHMIRHTFATLLLEQDVDIRYIQSLLGHSSVKTTEIYTHVSSAKQRQIMRDKNPRDFLCKEPASA